MMDEHDPFDDPTPNELAAVRDLLAHAGLWEDPPAGIEDAVVAAVVAAVAAEPAVAESAAIESVAESAAIESVAEPAAIESVADPSANEVPPAATPAFEHPTRAATPDDGSAVPVRRLRPAAPWWLAAAAAVAVVVTGVALIARDGETEPDVLAVALEPSDPASGASATAEVASTPAGLRIVLDVDGMPAAPPDSFYEAWLSDGRTSISCGTFHLRDGDEPIALWAGVADPAFDRLAVTLEPLDGDASSSGDVRLAGRIDFDEVEGYDVEEYDD